MIRGGLVFWSLVTGHWSLVTGAWCLVLGAWCLVLGAWCWCWCWCLVLGAWCLVLGAGAGAWCLLLAPCYFTSGAEADDAGFAAGGGDFEIDDAESAAFLATVGAAIAGADHDGVFVAGFAAEKHVNV